MKKEHSMQPVIWDGKGVVRFQENPIVSFLLDWANKRGMSLNELHRMSLSENWTNDDWAHFAQLHGYSVSGWGDLSYVSNDTCAKGDKAAETLLIMCPKDPEQE